jgi:hypothetical protein
VIGERTIEAVPVLTLGDSAEGGIEAAFAQEPSETFRARFSIEISAASAMSTETEPGRQSSPVAPAQGPSSLCRS